VWRKRRKGCGGRLDPTCKPTLCLPYEKTCTHSDSLGPLLLRLPVMTCEPVEGRQPLFVARIGLGEGR